MYYEALRKAHKGDAADQRPEAHSMSDEEGNSDTGDTQIESEVSRDALRDLDPAWPAPPCEAALLQLDKECADD